MIRYKSDFVNSNGIRHQVLIYDKDITTPANAVGSGLEWEDETLRFNSSTPSYFNPPITNTGIAIGLWVKPKVDIGTEQVIFYQENTIDSIVRKLIIKDSKFQYISQTNSAPSLTIESVDITANQWQHIFLYENEGDRMLFVNGVLKDSTSGTYSTNYTDSCRFGAANNPSQDDPFNGHLRDIRIWHDLDLGADTNLPQTLYEEIYNLIGTEASAFMLYENGGQDLRDFSNAIELPLAAPAYKISWDNGISEVLEGGICTSSCTLSFVNKQGELDDLLSIVLDGDNRLMVEIRKDNRSEWKGVMLQDFTEYPDEQYTTADLECTDSIGLLKDTEYDPTGADNGSLLDTIGRGLEEIASSGISESDVPLLYAKTNWFTENQGTSQESLYNLQTHSQLIWQENRQVEILGKKYDRMGYSYWYDVIDHILKRFNAVLIMSGGYWRIFQRPNLLTGIVEGNIDFFIYRKGTGYDSAVTQRFVNIQTVSDGNNIYRSRGRFFNLPAIGKITGIYGFGDNNNLLGMPPQFGVEYPTANLRGGADNYLQMDIHFQEQLVLVDSQPPMLIELQRSYKVQMKQGDYYLQEDGETWDTVASYVTIYSNILYYHHVEEWTGPVSANYPIFYVDASIRTDGLPTSEANGELVYVKVYDAAFEIFEVASGTSYELPYENMSYSPLSQDFETIYSIEYFFGEESAPTYAYFENNNPNPDYKLQYDTEVGKIGSTGGWFPRGHILPSTDGAAFGSYVNLEWGRGSETKDQYLTGLLITEILRQHKTPPLVFSGDLINKSGGNDLTGHLVFKITVLSEIYYFQGNKISYNPLEDTFSGDFIQIGTGSIPHVTAGDEELADISFGTVPVSGGIGNSIALDGLNRITGIVDLDTGDIDTDGGDIDTGGGDIDTDDGAIDTGTGNIDTKNVSLNDLYAAGSSVQFPALPTSDAGLKKGQLYVDVGTGTLKIKT